MNSGASGLRPHGHTSAGDGGTISMGGGGGGSGIDSGTSFPVSPTTNDLYFRTDRGLIFYFDGTRWLSSSQFTESIAMESIYVNNSGTGTSVTSTYAGWAPVPFFGVYDLWVCEFFAYTRVIITNTGSAYWNVGLLYEDATDSDLFTVATVDTSADTVNDHSAHRVSVEAALSSDARAMYLFLTKTGAPNVIQRLAASFTYRVIG